MTLDEHSIGIYENELIGGACANLTSKSNRLFFKADCQNNVHATVSGKEREVGLMVSA